MAQKQPSARFTEEHKVVLKDIILGDPELKAHIVHQSISSKERQTELWRILVDKFNELTGQKYVKEQISNFLSRIKRNELTERQRLLDEGVTTEPADFWLTSSNPQDLVRASPASFSQADINRLKDIITGDSEIRGVIFHGNPSNESSSAIWARLVDKFNRETGKSYNKNQIYRCLTRLKYREKNKDKIREVKPSKSTKRKATKKKYSDDEFLVDGSEGEDWMGDSDWLPDEDIDNYSAPAESAGESCLASTGIENLLGMIKGEALDKEFQNQEDAFNNSQLGNDIDWENSPLEGYLKTITPGYRENLRLQRLNLNLQMENQRLLNKKLKLDIRDELKC